MWAVDQKVTEVTLSLSTQSSKNLSQNFHTCIISINVKACNCYNSMILAYFCLVQQASYSFLVYDCDIMKEMVDCACTFQE